MKILLLLPIVLFSFRSNSQMIVSDPALATSAIEENLLMTKDLAETIRQSKTLTDSYKQVKEGVEIFKKVSSALKNLALVSDVLRNQIDLVKNISKVKTSFVSLNLTQQQKALSSKNLDKVLSEGNSNVELLKTLMKDDALNSNDGQRILILLEIKKSQQVINSKLLKVKRIINSQSSRNDLIEARNKRNSRRNL